MPYPTLGTAFDTIALRDPLKSILGGTEGIIGVVMFYKYQHVEKDGVEVDGILDGTVHVFHKLDGTNGSVWSEDGVLQFGSRNRHLVGTDNAKFKETFADDERLLALFRDHPTLTLYGEYLVPHSFKEYVDTAWRKYYVFDIIKDKQYIPYEEYVPLLEQYGIEYIPCIVVLDKPDLTTIHELAATKSTFLCKEGVPMGEGVVCKNYDFVNKFGRVTWMKKVNAEFKATRIGTKSKMKAMYSGLVEEEIVEAYLTLDIMEKVKANVALTRGGWSSHCIPQYLSTVYYDFIRETTWSWVKKYKNPKVDFKYLQRLVVDKAKDLIL